MMQDDDLKDEEAAGAVAGRVQSPPSLEGKQLKGVEPRRGGSPSFEASSSGITTTTATATVWAAVPTLPRCEEAGTQTEPTLVDAAAASALRAYSKSSSPPIGSCAGGRRLHALRLHVQRGWEEKEPMHQGLPAVSSEGGTVGGGWWTKKKKGSRNR